MRRRLSRRVTSAGGCASPILAHASTRLNFNKPGGTQTYSAKPKLKLARSCRSERGPALAQQRSDLKVNRRVPRCKLLFPFILLSCKKCSYAMEAMDLCTPSSLISSINHISAARDVHAATPDTVSSSRENSTETRCVGSLLHLHRILQPMLLSLSPKVGIFFAYCNHLCTVAEDLLLKPSLSWAYCTIGVLSLSMCLEKSPRLVLHNRAHRNYPTVHILLTKLHRLISPLPTS